MRDADQSCAEISLRLIAGEAPAADPVLASHVGSCLRCFRTAGEMREVPQIAGLLRQGQSKGAVPDPGEAFWADFPRTVATAWEQHRRKAGPGVPTATGWRRLLGWLRLPVPAALAGAAVTALLMAVVVGRSAAPPPERAIAAAVAEGTSDDEMGPGTVPGLLGDEDPWSLLELSDLKAVVARGDRDSAASTLDDLSDGTPSPAEEVGLLEDMDDPPALAEPGPPSRI